MPKTTSRKRDKGARRSSAKSTSTDLLREIALQFPDVEDATTERGLAFKARGRLLACSAINESAEPNSIVIRIGAEQRARLMAAHPSALYLPEHYAKHPAVLARLEKLDRESLRDILGAAWLFVAEKAVTRKPSAARRKR
jgi:hypothetical protein